MERTKKGFTKIEFLIVIFLLGMIGYTLAPVLLEPILVKKNTSGSKSQAQQLKKSKEFLETTVLYNKCSLMEIRYYGQNVYYFPITGEQFNACLAKFKNEHLPLTITAITPITNSGNLIAGYLVNTEPR